MCENVFFSYPCRVCFLDYLGWDGDRTQVSEYTIQFGRQMVDMYHDMVTTTRGQPALPDPLPSALESYLALPEGEIGLGYASLVDVFRYLRRGKSLHIPAEWKDHIPSPNS
jgi:hypothetical protein